MTAGDLDLVQATPAFVSDLVKARRPHLWRMDGGGFRFYYELTRECPIKFRTSWTSVIGDQLGFPIGLLDWYLENGREKAEALRDAAAHYGSCLHLVLGYFSEQKKINSEAIENIILAYAAKNKLHPIETFDDWYNKLWHDALAFAQFVNDRNVVPLAIEVPLISTKYNLAGTIDLVCEMEFNKKRVIAIVDIKSGRKGFYESHAIQLAAYQDMWNENYPELQATMSFNWSPKAWKDTPTYNLANQTGNASGAKLGSLVQMFFIDNPDPKPGPVRVFTGDIAFGMDLSSAYRDMDIQSFLELKHKDFFEEEQAKVTGKKKALLEAEF